MPAVLKAKTSIVLFAIFIFFAVAAALLCYKLFIETGRVKYSIISSDGSYIVEVLDNKKIEELFKRWNVFNPKGSYFRLSDGVIVKDRTVIKEIVVDVTGKQQDNGKVYNQKDNGELEVVSAYNNSYQEGILTVKVYISGEFLSSQENVTLTSSDLITRTLHIALRPKSPDNPTPSSEDPKRLYEEIKASLPLKLTAN